MTKLTIPLTFEQADRDWLNAALDETHPGTRIVSVTMSDKIGFKPTKRRLTICQLASAGLSMAPRAELAALRQILTATEERREARDHSTSIAEGP